MPLPRWLAQINKRVFNRLEVKRGVRPVLIHVGRSSGTTYSTPLDAHRVDGGYLFIPLYGPSTDWVKNALAAGSARLRIDGKEVELASPRLITQEVARQLLPASTKALSTIAKGSELLRMDIRHA